MRLRLKLRGELRLAHEARLAQIDARAEMNVNRSSVPHRRNQSFAQLRAELEQLRTTPDAELPAERLTGALFVTRSGTRLRQSQVFAMLRSYAGRTGLPAAKTVSPHSLRHTAATVALDAGATLRDLQDFLGHADPRTARRYDRSRGSCQGVIGAAPGG
jgi:integrase